MQIHTPIRSLATAMLTTSALALAACGEDGTTGGETAADRERQVQDAMIAYTKCMRDHGIDMPDPKVDGGRVQIRGPRGVSPERMQEAEEACRAHMEGVRGPEPSEEQQAEFREAALEHARCMREHGIGDFPDPTFGEDGSATIRIRRGRGGVDPDDPKFRAAQEACEDTMPDLGRTNREESP